MKESCNNTKCKYYNSKYDCNCQAEVNHMEKCMNNQMKESCKEYTPSGYCYKGEELQCSDCPKNPEWNQMKESEIRAICKLAGVDFIDYRDYFERENNLFAEAILTRAMVNYNLSKGEYYIDARGSNNAIVVFKRLTSCFIDNLNYTSIETYKLSLEKALCFVVGKK